MPQPVSDPPTVLQSISLRQLLTYALSLPKNGVEDTILIICLSQPAFIRLLLDTPSIAPLLEPALSLLSSSKHVKLAFCPSVQALQAYLATIPSWDESSHVPPGLDQQQLTPKPRRKIILAYPLLLHQHTPHYSAQGLSRTFASAVEAALRLRSELIVAEPAMERGDHAPRPDAQSMELDEPAEGTATAADENPWEQRVPILGASGSKFKAGERGWVGRTVSIRRVVGRWCTFRTFSNTSTLREPVERRMKLYDTTKSRETTK